MEHPALDELRTVVSRHLQEGEFETLANAIVIVTAANHLPDEFGQSVDQSSLEDLERALRNVSHSLENLSGAARFDIESHLGWSVGSEDEHNHFKRYLAETRRLLDAVSKMRRANAKLRKPHGRSNWRAASVAYICGLLWSAADKGEPPKGVQSSAPGPYGNFLQEVFDTLGIETQPRAALDQLRRLDPGRDNAKSKNL